MITAIGQDSHRFDESDKTKKLILAGVEVQDMPPLSANSDGDVVFHAITNAVSGITTVNILGEIADEMCKNGIYDSAKYIDKAMEYLGKYQITHISLSIECKRPKITPLIPFMRKNIAIKLKLPESSVGITATSGERLTAFGRGEGIQVFCIITAT